jgi:ParB family chromosome partitioning protein
MGDLSALAASIAEVGLLQPIGVSADGELVFGERRLRACRDLLGWTEIPPVS